MLRVFQTSPLLLHQFFEGAFHVAGNKFVQSFQDLRINHWSQSILVCRLVLKSVEFIAALGRIDASELV